MRDTAPRRSHYRRSLARRDEEFLGDPKCIRCRDICVILGGYVAIFENVVAHPCLVYTEGLSQ